MEHTKKDTGVPMFSRRKLYGLIWPLVVEQLLSVFVGMVDVLMIAAVGEAAVSGVSLVDSINILLNQILFALTAGGTVVCARKMGAGDERGASRTAGQLLTDTMILSASIMLVVLFNSRFILHALFAQAEDAVIGNALIYLRITVCSFPFLALTNAVGAIYRAQGNTRTPMRWSLAINAINIAGNALCIFVLKMGVEGVAIPTLIARGIGAVGILVQLQRSNSAARVRSMTDLKPNGDLTRQILAIGVPNGIESGLFHFGKLMLTSLVSSLGTASIAAFAVASNLVMFLYLPGNALGAALLTIVGQCVGKGEWNQAKNYTKQLIFVNYMMVFVVAGVMGLFRTLLIGLYNLSPDASVLACALLLSHCIAMVIWPLCFLTPYYFRAIGRARYTMIVSVSVMWVFRIGLAYVFVRLLKMNVLSVWYAMYIDWIARLVIYIPAFKRQQPLANKQTR